MSFRVEKEWIYRGNTCVVIMSDFGYRCGYVGIDESHPLYGMKYSDYVPESLLDKYREIENKPVGKRGIIDLICCDMSNPRIGILFDVHGGITYSGGKGKYPIPSDLWWFGFDCDHFGDAKDLTEVAVPLVTTEIGGTVRTLEYCISECESLSGQLNYLRKD